jgi:subtilase family serine protease
MSRSIYRCIPGLYRIFAIWQSRLVRQVKTQILVAAALLWASAVLSATVSEVVPTQVLSGHVPKLTQQLPALGRFNASYRLQVAIGLPLRNREQLTNLLADIYNPASPNYRHFLKPDEFAASFAPSVEDYQSVMDFAKIHHLTVTHTHSNRTLVRVSGSVADIENAFHIHLQTFQHPTENRMVFAPDVEPSLDLKTPVLAISGLDNARQPQPRMHSARMATLNARPLGGGGSGGGGGTGGSNTGPFAGYDFRNAYAPDVALDGTGQSVGLFELFGFNPQDIQDYEDAVGIFPYVNVQPVLIDGASGDSANADYTTYPGFLNYAFEVTGDIEVAIAMAPGLSSVLVYEGPTPMDLPPMGTNYIQDATTTAQINDVLNRMATDNLAKQLSCSYGFDINLSTVQIFQQYAAQGQSFFLASGDAGAYSGAVDEPADDPYVTVVGGTTLTLTSTGAWSSETAWLTPATVDPLAGSIPEAASGGGVSLAYGIPPWQQGISMTANQGSTTMRNSPDVSMVANNLNIVWGNDFIGASSDFPEGGTSLAAPLWAGLMALANQQAAANGQPPIGFANPVLYAIAKSTNYQACFHDITTGSNTNKSNPTKYMAVTGYDLCTGLGTPTGSNLIAALLAPPSDTLLVTPPLGFTAFGPGGGPFTVTSQTYTLKNIGSNPLNWSLVNTSGWLTVSATSGSLNTGASTTVTISLNSTANNFLINHATGNIGLNNLTAGTTQNRQFDLSVGNGGFETGDLTDWTLTGSPELVFALAADDADVAGTAALPGQPDGVFVHSGLYGAYLGEWAWNSYPAVGSLAQTVATTAGQKYLVSFWLTCLPDSSGVTTNNQFGAKWNNSKLYAQTNLPAFGWTNLQFVVPATAAQTPLEFDFNHDPGAFGLDDVTVQPVPGPVLNSAAVSNGNIAFSWGGFLNVSYQIQTTTNLSHSGWINLGSPILATNNVVNVSLPVDNAPSQFYRIILSP